MRNFIKTASIVVLTATSLLLGGCMGYQRTIANKTSLVEFLYPDRSGYVELTGIPQLSLPLRVGVAYTPATMATQGFTEREKTLLAEQVISAFDSLDFVGSLTLIPSDYLRKGGSFSNLEQLQQLFGVDVIVLLSYDQSIVTSRDFAALTYWTIVGAYLIPAEKNDTQTLLDAAVYDIASRKLLFRAPGTSVVKSRDTLINNSEKVRISSIEGFTLASENLTMNLGEELENFKTRVREQPEQYRVSMRSGYSGSGSTEGLFLLLVSALLFSVLLQGCKCRKNL